MNINIFRLIEISKKKKKKRENKIQINSLAFILNSKEQCAATEASSFSISLYFKWFRVCVCVCIYKHIPIKQQIPHFAYLKKILFSL